MKSKHILKSTFKMVFLSLSGLAVIGFGPALAGVLEEVTVNA